MQPLTDSLFDRNVGLDRLIHLLAGKEAAFPGEYVESHLFMQETNQPSSCVDRCAVTVGLISELDNTSVSNGCFEKLKITEISVFWINGADWERIVRKPPHPRIQLRLGRSTRRLRLRGS